jgi:plastocyanin
MATHTDHGHAHGHAPNDRVPAFVGLLGGGAFVGGVLYAVVLWTNAQFAGHEGREKAPLAAAESPGPEPTPPAGGATPAGAGTTHTVRMLGDAQGYRFEPANVAVKAGDAVKFVNVSGGPHNAAFDPAAVPDDVEPVLSKNMPDQMSPLAGKLLVNPNESYTISFAGVKAGAYNYFCSPHLAMNMKGVITVE